MTYWHFSQVFLWFEKTTVLRLPFGADCLIIRSLFQYNTSLWRTNGRTPSYSILIPRYMSVTWLKRDHSEQIAGPFRSVRVSDTPLAWNVSTFHSCLQLCIVLFTSVTQSTTAAWNVTTVVTVMTYYV